MKLKKLIVVVALLCVGMLTISGMAQDQVATNKTTTGVTQPAATSNAIALPADVAGQVKDLRAAFETIQTQKELIMAREKNVQALLAVQFNRACAKLKLDPDLHEWTEDLSGIRPKTPPKK